MVGETHDCLARRRFCFRLRTMLVAVTLLAIAIAWLAQLARHAQQRNRSVAALREMGAVVWDRDSRNASGLLDRIKRTARWRDVTIASRINTNRAASHLQGMTQLNLLGIGGNVTDAGLVYLRGLSSLRSLSIQSPDVADEGLRHVSSLSSLTELNLHGTGTTDSGLAHLSRLTQLQRLALECPRITDDGLKHLEDLTNLKYLSLRGTKVTNSGLVYLKGMSQLELVIEDTAVTYAGVAHLLMDLQGRSLDEVIDMVLGSQDPRYVNLRGQQVTDDFVPYLLRAASSIESLTLASTGITETGFAQLGGLNELRHLTLHGLQDQRLPWTYLKGADKLLRIGLSGQRLDRRHVEDIGTLSHLQHLTLHFSDVSDEEDVFSRLDGLSNLKVLNLRGTPVTGAGFAHLRPLKQLETLYLEHTAVASKGLDHLIALTNLSSLKLSRAPLDEEGLRSVGKLSQVTTLALYATDITDDNLRHLAGMTNLEKLDLGETSVSGVGIAHLQGLQNLHELSLYRTNISDSAIPELKKLAHLRKLVLSGTRITKDGVSRLHIALPECKIQAREFENRIVYGQTDAE